MDEKQLSEQLKTYQQLAKENKDIDLGALAMSALQNQESNNLTAKEKRFAYWVSIGVPPFGLIYAVKFYFSDKNDGKKAAWICVILTVLSIAVFFGLFGIILSSSNLNGANLDQLQQAPSQLNQLLK